MKVVAQRQPGDCGVAALVMITGQPYEDVYAAATRIAPRVGKTGLYIHNLIAIAKSLGVALERRRAYSLEDDDGILSVRGGKGSPFDWHFVVLWHGAIVDPSGGHLEDPADFFLLTKSKPCTLLVHV